MPPKKKSTAKFILTVDGGGIRGLIAARVLSRLAEEIRAVKKTEDELHAYFDMMVGTSTGSIIVSGLACPVLPGGGHQVAAATTEQLEMLFRERGKDIFDPDTYAYLRTFPMYLANVWNKERYTTTTLSNILDAQVGRTALKSALTKIIVPSYRLDTRNPVLMSNITSLSDRYGYYTFKDSVLASTAAPTYFPPIQVEQLVNNPVKQTMVDGGLYAADPALIAYANAIDLGWDDFYIISIGTGTERREYPYHEVKNWRVLDWVSPSRGVPILNIMMQGQAEMTDLVLRTIMNKDTDNRRYWKIDEHLTGVNDDMDDASSDNIESMLGFADKITHKYSAELKAIAALL